MGVYLLWKELNLETRHKAMRILFLVKNKYYWCWYLIQTQSKYKYMILNFHLLVWYKETVGRIGNALKGDPFISMILWQVINSEQCCSQCTLPAVPIIQLIDFFQSFFSAYHVFIWVAFPNFEEFLADKKVTPHLLQMSLCYPKNTVCPAVGLHFYTELLLVTVCMFVPHKGTQNKTN